MEHQNTSGPVEKVFPKILHLVFRGGVVGMAGAIQVGWIMGSIQGLFEFFSYVNSHGLSQSEIVQHLNFLISYNIGNAIFGYVTAAIPIGLVIGISTGALASKFGPSCPKLPVWLLLSWLGATMGVSLAVLPFLGWPSFDILLGITVISLAASWMAYQVTIQEVQKGIPKQAPRIYTVLCSVCHVGLIFLALGSFFFLTSMST